MINKVQQHIKEIWPNQTYDDHKFESFLWFIEHPDTTFDVAFHHFYPHEPLLQVTFKKAYAHDLWATFAYARSDTKLRDLLDHVEFSDGTIAPYNAIWMLVYMPYNLAIDRIVDLQDGEQVAGPNDETLREMIHNTYRCASRAEEDYFLRRWLAS